MKEGKKEGSPGLKLTSTYDDRLTCTLFEPLPDGLWKARFEPFDLLVPTLEQHGQLVDDTIDLQHADIVAGTRKGETALRLHGGELDNGSSLLCYATARVTFHSLCDSHIQRSVSISGGVDIAIQGPWTTPRPISETVKRRRLPAPVGLKKSCKLRQEHPRSN